jgi:hypothetical protein
MSTHFTIGIEEEFQTQTSSPILRRPTRKCEHCEPDWRGWSLRKDSC